MDPSYVTLHSSRGLETTSHKLFMRQTVLIADVLIFLPAAIFLCRGQQGTSRLTALAALVLYPGLIVIDHGHFQYNGISLGLFLAAIGNFIRDNDVLGSVFFTCALNYKQMELYHALPVFFYLLGKCWAKATWISALSKLVSIGITVIVTFAGIWAPFLTPLERTKQVISRLFPVARGLFEDKVANFWCSLNSLIKIREFLDGEQLLGLCAIITLAYSLPSCLTVLRQPTPRNLTLSLVNVSFAFFLFSFQVHEKSILLVAAPIAAHLAVSCCSKKALEECRRQEKFVCAWFLIVSTLSMMPLLIKEGLVVPTLGLTGFYTVGCAASGLLSPVRLNSKSSLATRTPRRVQPIPKPSLFSSLSFLRDDVVWMRMLMSVSLLGCLVLTACALWAPVPIRLPDLWAVALSAYAFAHFALFCVYFNWTQLVPKKKLQFTTEKKVN